MRINQFGVDEDAIHEVAAAKADAEVKQLPLEGIERLHWWMKVYKRTFISMAMPTSKWPDDM